MDHIENRIEQVVNCILDDYSLGRQIDRIEPFSSADKEIVIDIVEKLLRIVFPGYYRDKNYRIYNAKHNLSMLIEDITFNLNRQIDLVLQRAGMKAEDAAEASQKICLAFLDRIPKVRSYVQMDLETFYEGDPAATCYDEIIYCYPGLFAVTINRLAHELHLLNVPMIPRMMTEYAHGATGIDIHPGATIGKCFFIDHGTGIVVGETTVIGDHVKVYQGVTLGALTTRGGQSLRGKKRHPTIEDNVTIYAGASILGGETVIGHDCVIGSNAFITKSIPPCTTVSFKNAELLMKQRCDSPNCSG